MARDALADAPVLWSAVAILARTIPRVARVDGSNSGGVTVQSNEWVPAGIDTERPSPARMYDYLLGGAHNFAVDRNVAEQAIAADPEVAKTAWVNLPSTVR